MVLTIHSAAILMMMVLHASASLDRRRVVMHLSNLVHRLVLMLSAGPAIVAGRSRTILLAVPHLVQITIVAAFRLIGWWQTVGSYWFDLIATLLMGTRGLVRVVVVHFWGLSNEGVEVGEVYLGTNEVVDFGRLIVLDCLHVVLILLCIAILRLLL